jgi:hypothetical protein
MCSTSEANFTKFSHGAVFPLVDSHNEIKDSGAQRLAASLGGDSAALKTHGITG